MRRADRLFELLQILRRSRRPRTAQSLADEVETSRRTIYRDLAVLRDQGMPIRGEAGIGFVLDAGFDLPPLSFTPREVDAIALGARWVASHADPAMANAALDVLSKVATVLPANARGRLASPVVTTAPSRDQIRSDTEPLEDLRNATYDEVTLRIRYLDASGGRTERTVWPVLIGYLEDVRTLVAWCTLRDGFRWFRVDRIEHIERLHTPIPVPRRELVRRWHVQVEQRL